MREYRGIIQAFAMFVGFAFVPATAIADVTLESYLNGKQTPSMQTYVAGVGVGIFWANIGAKVHHKKKLYCQPESLTLMPENYRRILDDEIERGHYNPDTPIEMILVEGLIRTFPCR